MRKISSPCLMSVLALMSAVCMFTFSACKKEKNKDDTAAQQEQLLKDSVYIYTNEVYLWDDALPPSFETKSYKTAEDVLEELKTYKKDANGVALDRYSFLDRKGEVADEIQNGIQGDFGFNLGYHINDDLRIGMVYANSPASEAGIQRSWRILSINGNNSISYSVLSANKFQTLNTALGANTIKLSLQKLDNSITNVTLTKKEYAIDPVLYSNVYTTSNGKKVGYFVFNTFVAVSNNNLPTSTKTKIDAVMKTFEEARVTEVIVDLRYNGGGAVETAEYLTNLLVPPVNDGKRMYSYTLNSILAAMDNFKKAFAPVAITKIGALNPRTIYFIVTGGTASASELLINNLKPYVKVKLIGEEATYGKPVGFFGIDILGNDLYAVSFKTMNANNEGDYYSGMPVDQFEYDDLVHTLGSTDEGCLAQALYYAQHGFFKTATASTSSVSAKRNTVSSSIQMNKILNGNKDMYKFNVPTVKPLP